MDHKIIPDDGRDGVFFRGGDRWVRSHGVETRLLDIMPEVERTALDAFAELGSPVLVALQLSGR